MAISPRRKLAVGAAGLAVLAGSGGAYAATQKSSSTRPDPAAEQKAFLDDLAGRLNVTTDQLNAAIKGAAEDRIDAAVKAGRLTQDRADKIKQRIEQANGLPLLGGPRFGPGPLRLHPGGPAIGPFGEFRAAAKYLGLTNKQLFEQLRNGKSLADVAKDQGKSVDGLKQALEAAQKARLDAAVKAGRLTDAERKQVEADLDQRLDDFINRTPPKRPMLHLRRWP